MKSPRLSLVAAAAFTAALATFAVFGASAQASPGQANAATVLKTPAVTISMLGAAGYHQMAPPPQAITLKASLDIGQQQQIGHANATKHQAAAPAHGIVYMSWNKAKNTDAKMATSSPSVAGFDRTAAGPPSAANELVRHQGTLKAA